MEKVEDFYRKTRKYIFKQDSLYVSSQNFDNIQLIITYLLENKNEGIDENSN